MPLPVTYPVFFVIPNGAGGFDAIEVDACLSEQHALTNRLTDHPVEQGFNVTDHSRPMPRTVSLDCVVSNTPLTGNPDGTDFALTIWRRFVQLHNQPQLVDVQTARDYYTSMGVESVTSPVDVKSANALRFTISLKEVRVVQNKFTQIVKAKDTRAHANRKQGATMVFTLAETDPDTRNVSSAFKLAGLPLQ
jgi:hypothetical protein